MKKVSFLLLLSVFVLTACGPNSPFAPSTATPTSVPTFTPPPTATFTPSLTPTPLYPAEGYGPINFPSDVNPLTGLKVTDPALLERRPLAVKVSNIPRYVRPQWGLSLADIVYEYYTEFGSTRFIAIFLGNDATQVGPIRSARFFDGHVVRGYKAVFAFGSGAQYTLNRLYNSEYANRLVIWTSCPPMCIFDPQGYSFLLTNTSDLSAYITQKGVENGRQNLDGMFFQLDPPSGGDTGEHFWLRYSSAIYNRWDYDALTGKYLRSSDTKDDFALGQNEVYEPQSDRLTNQPIAFDNVVILQVTHEFYLRRADAEVVDILFGGTGTAYAFRDGRMYQVVWRRTGPHDVVSLSYPDGTPFPFKPGTTWFEVMGTTTEVKQVDEGVRFIFHIP